MLPALLLVAAPFVYVATKKLRPHSAQKKLAANADEHTGTPVSGEVVDDTADQATDQSLEKRLAPIKIPGWVNTVRQRVERWDARMQRLIQTRIDAKLMGKEFTEQLAAMSKGQLREPGPEEKYFNRALVSGVVGAGLLLVGNVFALPVIPLVCGIAAYNLWPLAKESWAVLWHERRLSLLHMLFLYLSGLWLGGYYLIGIFGLALFAVSQKMLYLSQTITRHSLTNLLGEQPQTVWILVDGTEVEVEFSALSIGDILVLNAGQPVPVDGTIVDGSASIDQHRLTGESQPAEKTVGDTVLAGTLVLGGRLSVAVEKTGAETSAAKISNVLEHTVNQHEMAMADQFRDFEPTLLPTLASSAVALALGAPVIAAAILGCNYFANVVSLRALTMLNGLKANAEYGVLIKDGAALEKLASVDTLVFDKTGTLTVEEPNIAAIHCTKDHTEESVLTFAAAAEQRQSHPIAQAILSLAAEKQLTLPHVDEAQYQLGLGLLVEIDGQQVRVGSEKFLLTEKLALPDNLQQAQAAAHEQGRAIVFVAVDNAVIGGIELASTVRPEAQHVIDWLKAQGISMYILSGDQEAPTRALSNQLGLHGYSANTLPEQKAEYLQSLQQQGRTVCFVGDGINDAIALQQADVSISLRGATTIATDSADIVLMNDNLEQLIRLWKVAKGFNANVASSIRTTGWFGVLAATGVIFLPLKFLVVEVLWGTHMITGIKKAYQPLVPEDKRLEDQSTD